MSRKSDTVRACLALLILILALGCEARKEANDEERAEIEARYDALAALRDAIPASPTETACDDAAIEAMDRGRYARNRRRLKVMDAALLDVIVEGESAESAPEWARFRSAAFKELPARAEAFEGDHWKRSRRILDDAFDDRLIVLLHPAQPEDGPNFSGWLAIADLEAGALLCQTPLESQARQARLSARGLSKYDHRQDFLRDADTILREMSEHFELR